MSHVRRILLKVLVFLLFQSKGSMTTLPHYTRGMKVAVVGGGLSGLACAYNILQLAPSSLVTIVDPISSPHLRATDENTASVAAAGLMHPFSPSGGLMWRGFECYSKALELIHTVEETIGCEIYDRNVRVLRPALKPKDVIRMRKTAQDFPHSCEFYDHSAGQKKFGSTFLPHWEGVALYKASIIVNTPLYLSSLWRTICILHPSITWSDQLMRCDKVHLSDPMCSQKSKYDEKDIYIMDALSEFDAVVLASGAGVRDLWPRDQLAPPMPSLKYVRGQNLFLDSQSALGEDRNDCEQRYAILCGEYVVPSDFGQSWIVGATHEYAEATLTAPPDATTAVNLLSGKLANLTGVSGIPPDIKPIKTVSGIRVTAKRTQYGKLPIVGRVR